MASMRIVPLMEKSKKKDQDKPERSARFVLPPHLRCNRFVVLLCMVTVQGAFCTWISLFYVHNIRF